MKFNIPNELDWLIDCCSISPQNLCFQIFREELQLVSLPSTQTGKARGEIKYSVLRVLIFMYIHCGEHFLKMNNHRRKGHRCAEVVHYGSGIIAFLTLVPIVMKSWQCLTLNDRLGHRPITQVWVWGGGVDGGSRRWADGGQLAFVEKRGSPKSLCDSFVSFSVLLTNGATFIKGLCRCSLIVLEWELLSEEREWIERNDL